MTYFPRIVKTAGGVTGDRYTTNVSYEVVRSSDSVVVTTRTLALHLNTSSFRANLEKVRDDMEKFLLAQSGGDPLQFAKTAVSNMTDTDWQRYGL
jgi:hypothetical protein